MPLYQNISIKRENKNILCCNNKFEKNGSLKRFDYPEWEK